MFDLNDPRLTNQGRRDFLSMQIPELAVERIKNQSIAETQGLRRSSPSYWVLKPEDLLLMSKWTDNTDLMMKHNPECYELLVPDWDIIVLEHDSVQEGEWDNFMGRKSPLSYTCTCVISVQGKLVGELPIHLDDEDCEWSIDQSTNYRIGDYSLSSKHLKQNDPLPLKSLGLLDCPNHLLDSFEDKRVHKRTWIFSHQFEEVMEKFSKKVFGHDFLKPTSIKKKRKKKNDKGFG